MKTVLTIGHSTHTADRFLDLLHGAGVLVLVDVRSKPYSRWNPQYNRPTLQKMLTSAGVRYEWRGGNLGGLAGNSRYQETIEEVLSWDHVAVMCSEGSPAKCHRSTMLAPSFTALGAEVLHILPNGQLQPDSRPSLF